MNQSIVLETEFVRSIPEKLEEGILYVSMEYATVVHKCCCGCGLEVPTPLSPTDWKLTYDGVSVSLYPSIGNWSFPCRSHYWIDKSKARWVGEMTGEQIDAGRAHDRRAKERYLGEISATKLYNTARPSAGTERASLWSRFRKWLSGD